MQNYFAKTFGGLEISCYLYVIVNHINENLPMAQT
jgi:hypothetical protein